MHSKVGFNLRSHNHRECHKCDCVPEEYLFRFCTSSCAVCFSGSDVDGWQVPFPAVAAHISGTGLIFLLLRRLLCCHCCCSPCSKERWCTDLFCCDFSVAWRACSGCQGALSGSAALWQRGSNKCPSFSSVRNVLAGLTGCCLSLARLCWFHGLCGDLCTASLCQVLLCSDFSFEN